MNLIFCGPCFSEKAIKEKRAVSQAGVRWACGLVAALRGLGHNVIVISHCTEQLWPRGRVIWQDSARHWFSDSNCLGISYPNVPYVREKWLCWRYASAVQSICSCESVNAILCYNSFVPWHVAAMKSAQKCGIKSIPIILDGDNPNKDNWKKLLSDNRYADGIVFLSHWLKENYPLGVPQGGILPVYQLDGGSDNFYGEPPKASQDGHPFTVAHTGSLNPNRELAFIAKTLKAYKDPDTRFVFTGKYDHEIVREKLGNDPRVELKGMVSAVELNRICAEVDVFISARSPSIVDFPSKLPNYLAWGRPVVATWIESLSPEYKDLLFIANDNSPEGMAKQLSRVKDLDLPAKTILYQRIASWFQQKKTWTAQAKGLAEWIESVR